MEIECIDKNKPMINHPADAKCCVCSKGIDDCSLFLISTKIGPCTYWMCKDCSLSIKDAIDSAVYTFKIGEND